MNDLLLIAIFGLPCLPLNEEQRIFVGGLLLLNVLIAVFIVTMGLESLGTRGRTFVLGILVAAALYMSVRGLWSSGDPLFEWRAYFADLRVFCGCIAGALWFRGRDAERQRLVLNGCTLAVVLVALVSVAGFYSGLVRPVQDTAARIIMPWLFFAAGYLECLLPFHVAAASIAPQKRWRAAAVILALASFGLIAFVAFEGATRSVLIVAVVCALLGLMLTAKSRRLKLCMLFVLFGLLLAAVSEPFIPRLLTSAESEVVRRLVATDVTGETRYIELREMLDRLGNDLPLGLGFGSGFWSSYAGPSLTPAPVPHISIATLLLKGGVLVFLPVVIVPVLMTLWGVARLAVETGHVRRRAAWAGLCVYVVLASMSGGWDFGLLFLCSVFFLNARKAEVAARARGRVFRHRDRALRRAKLDARGIGKEHPTIVA